MIGIQDNVPAIQIGEGRERFWQDIGIGQTTFFSVMPRLTTGLGCVSTDESPECKIWYAPWDQFACQSWGSHRTSFPWSLGWKCRRVVKLVPLECSGNNRENKIQTRYFMRLQTPFQAYSHPASFSPVSCVV